MWTLYIVISGLTDPIVIDGTSKRWCEETGAAAIAALAEPGQGRFWCVKLPDFVSLPGIKQSSFTLRSDEDT